MGRVKRIASGQERTGTASKSEKSFSSRQQHTRLYIEDVTEKTMLSLNKTNSNRLRERKILRDATNVCSQKTSSAKDVQLKRDIKYRKDILAPKTENCPQMSSLNDSISLSLRSKTRICALAPSRLKAPSISKAESYTSRLRNSTQGRIRIPKHLINAPKQTVEKGSALLKSKAREAVVSSTRTRKEVKCFTPSKVKKSTVTRASSRSKHGSVTPSPSQVKGNGIPKKKSKDHVKPETQKVYNSRSSNSFSFVKRNSLKENVIVGEKGCGKISPSNKERKSIPIYRSLQIEEANKRHSTKKNEAVYEFEIDPSEEPKVDVKKKKLVRTRRQKEPTDPGSTIKPRQKQRKKVAPAKQTVEESLSLNVSSVCGKLQNSVCEVNDLNKESMELPAEMAISVEGDCTRNEESVLPCQAKSLEKEMAVSNAEQPVTDDNCVKEAPEKVLREKASTENQQPVQTVLSQKQVTLLQFFSPTMRKRQFTKFTRMSEENGVGNIAPKMTMHRYSNNFSNPAIVCSTPDSCDDRFKGPIKNHSTPCDTGSETRTDAELGVDKCFGFTDEEEETRESFLSPVKASGFCGRIFIDSSPMKQKELVVPAPSRFSFGKLKPSLANLRARNAASTTTAIPKKLKNSCSTLPLVRQERTTTAASVLQKTPDSPPVTFRKPARRSYERRNFHIIKRKIMEEEQENDENSDEEKAPARKKKTDKRKEKKQDKEVEKWASLVNSELAEVESFELCVE